MNWKFNITNEDQPNEQIWVRGKLRMSPHIPLVDISGEIFENENISLSLQLSWDASASDPAWVPLPKLPILEVSSLRGTFLGPSDWDRALGSESLTANLSSTPGDEVILADGGVLSLRSGWVFEQQFDLHVHPSSTVGSSLERQVVLRGALVLAASSSSEELVSDQFTADVDLDTGFLIGQFSGPGGWSPLVMGMPGRDVFAIPPFTGELTTSDPATDHDGTLVVKAETTVAYTEPLSIHGGRIIFSHPSIGQQDSGPSLQIRVEEENFAGDAVTEHSVEFTASMQLTGDPAHLTNPPPLLVIPSQTIPPSGDFVMTLEGKQWSPLPASLTDAVPLRFLSTQGTATIGTDGQVDVELDTASTMVRAFGAWLHFHDLEVKTHTSGSLDSTGSTTLNGALTFSFDGNTYLADAFGDGLPVRTLGSIDPMTGESNFTLSHSGGWMPVRVPRKQRGISIVELFALPSFEGQGAWTDDLTTGVQALTIRASIEYPLDPIQLWRNRPRGVAADGSPKEWSTHWPRTEGDKLILAGLNSAQGLSPTLDYALTISTAIRAAGHVDAYYINSSAFALDGVLQGQDIALNLTLAMFTTTMKGQSNVNQAFTAQVYTITSSATPFEPFTTLPSKPSSTYPLSPPPTPHHTPSTHLSTH